MEFKATDYLGEKEQGGKGTPGLLQFADCWQSSDPHSEVQGGQGVSAKIFLKDAAARFKTSSNFENHVVCYLGEFWKRADRAGDGVRDWKHPVGRSLLNTIILREMQT